MKKAAWGFALVAVLATAHAETYYTYEQLGGPMTGVQLHGLSEAQLDLRVAILQRKAERANAKLRCVSENFGKNPFKAGGYEDLCSQWN